jgi:hypothetical protein
MPTMVILTIRAGTAIPLVIPAKLGAATYAVRPALRPVGIP